MSSGPDLYVHIMCGEGGVLVWTGGKAYMGVG